MTHPNRQPTLLEQARLTDAETPYIETCDNEGDRIAHRAIANAATRKFAEVIADWIWKYTDRECAPETDIRAFGHEIANEIRAQLHPGEAK